MGRVWLVVLGVSLGGVARGDDWVQSDDALDHLTAHGDELYATSSEGVWRSIDGGATWKRMLSIPDEPRCAIASSKGRVWATGCGDDGRAFTSTGGEWVALPAAKGKTIAADDGRRLWASDENGKLQFSDDRGKSWRGDLSSKCTIARSAITGAQRVWVTCDDGVYASTTVDERSFRRADPVALAVDASDDRVVWGTADAGCTLVRSGDGGATWRGVLRASPRVDPTDGSLSCDDDARFTVAASAGRHVYAGRSSELLASADGGATFGPGGDLPAQTTMLVATSSLLFAVSPGSVLRVPLPAPGPSSLPAPDPERKLGPFERGKAGSWTQLTGLSSEELFAAGTTLIAVGMNDVDAAWISVDEGKAWKTLPGCPSPQGVAVSRADPRKIWISGCVAAGGVPMPPLASSDGGKTFTPVVAALGVLVLAFDDRGVLWGGDNGRLVSSKDGGATWINRGLVPVDEGPTRIMAAPPGIWVFGKLGGWDATHDGGRTWKTPEWSGAYVGASLGSDGSTLWVPANLGCAMMESSDGGKSFHALFEHPVERLNARDHGGATCPQAFQIGAFAVDGGGVPWFSVGGDLRRGAKSVSKLPTGVTAYETLSVAVTAHAIFLADLNANVWVMPRP